MNTPSVKSFNALRTLKLKVDDRVQITKAGGMFKARLHGHRNFVFGSTRAEALVRLRNTQFSKKWSPIRVVVTPLEQQLMDGLR